MGWGDSSRKLQPRHEHTHLIPPHTLCAAGLMLQALRGGAMCVEAPQRLLVYDSQLRDNTADVDGGGVLLVSVTNGTVNIVRSPIKNNTVGSSAQVLTC